jgi:hypothetical protein
VKKVKIILVTAAAGFCTSQQEHEQIKKISRYFGATGYEVKHTHSNGWTRAWHKAKAWFTGYEPANVLDGATGQDIIVGVGAACRCLVSAAAKKTGPLRLILIEPVLPEGEIFPSSIDHVLLFYNTALRGGTMGADGYYPKADNLPYEVETKNIIKRDLHHYSTWLWREILRSRLARNQRILNNGA